MFSITLCHHNQKQRSNKLFKNTQKIGLCWKILKMVLALNFSLCNLVYLSNFFLGLFVHFLYIQRHRGRALPCMWQWQQDYKQDKWKDLQKKTTFLSNWIHWKTEFVFFKISTYGLIPSLSRISKMSFIRFECDLHTGW